MFLFLIEKFQIRICEKAYVLTTILPLLNSDNEVVSIKYGAKILSYLT
jgi:hypothetical protein